MILSKFLFNIKNFLIIYTKFKKKYISRKKYEQVEHAVTEVTPVVEV